jgi:hypothetical protein
LFPLFASGVINTGVIAAGIVDKSWQNFHRYQTTLAKLVAKFAAGVVDTGGKFATIVIDTCGAP